MTTHAIRKTGPSNSSADWVDKLLSGTGSVFDRNSFKDWWLIYLASRVKFSIAQQVLEADLRSPAQHLDNIRKTLNPPIADLAIFFGVSRQSIYKWLAETSQPEVVHLDRIRKLSIMADCFKKNGIFRAGTLIRLKVFNGKSLMDLISEGTDNESHIDAIISEAKILEEKYTQSGLAKSATEATENWKNTYSIPHYQEDNK